MRRVAVTGMAGITPFGSDWDSVAAGLKRRQNAVRYMPEWEIYQGMHTKLAAPADCFKTPSHYSRKTLRSMSRVSVMSTAATELALQDAGLLGDPVIASGDTGIAYGSSSGDPQATCDVVSMIYQKSVENITGTTYVKMMPHTTAVNTGLYFGVKGRVIPTSSACTSGSQAIGYAYEAIAFGRQQVMIAGGAEQLIVAQAAIFDTLYATSQKNDAPHTSPAPFDRDRDGLVIGEGAGTLILEDYERAQARGARIYAEIVGFATNCDASHITQPRMETMQRCMQMSLDDAGLAAEDIGFIKAHGTATARGDIAESQAAFRIFGSNKPVTSLKSYFGHSLGACGAIESWLAIEMMRHNWIAPTLNLRHPDPECGELDYVMDECRPLECEFVQANNFAFGGINTSLIFKRVD